jgi:hypothetical protein
VTWSAAVPLDARPARVDELIAGQPSDAAGRRLIDCECYAYLADRVFSSGRFEVLYVQRPGHVTAMVTDRTTQAILGVDNDDVSDLGKAETLRQRIDAAGKLIAGNTYAIFFVADRPSRASAADYAGLPKKGAIAWAGEFVGFVDDRTVEHYAETARAAGRRIDFSAYVAKVARGD